MNSLRSEISAACLDFCLSFSWGSLWLPPPHSTSCRQEPAWSHRRQLTETGWGPHLSLAGARSRPCPFIHFFLSIMDVRCCRNFLHNKNQTPLTLSDPKYLSSGKLKSILLRMICKSNKKIHSGRKKC